MKLPNKQPRDFEMEKPLSAISRDSEEVTALLPPVLCNIGNSLNAFIVTSIFFSFKKEILTFPFCSRAKPRLFINLFVRDIVDVRLRSRCHELTVSMLPCRGLINLIMKASIISYLYRVKCCSNHSFHCFTTNFHILHIHFNCGHP